MDMVISYDAENKEEEAKISDNYIELGFPHEALFLVLTYLPLFELLAMSEACRSFRDALNNDILPWLRIVVEKPLNLRISDEIMMRITSKADGRLRTLVLNNCVKITDNGLQDVIAQNPYINKLHVTSCTSLTPDGIIRAVMTLNLQNPHLRSLKINGIYNLNEEHLEALHTLLELNQMHQQQQYKKRRNLYPERKHSPSKEEETDYHSIDVEICPKCNEVRQVFDCPDETCERKRIRRLRECRGCIFCIPRCEECGKCVEFEEECEVACADMLCAGCWLQLPKCVFCNKPYCSQHANKQCTIPGTSRFVCETCHEQFISNSVD